MNDVRPLSSGTAQEELYATFSNSLKALANKARKESVNMKGIQRDPAAAKEYAAEVASLNEKYQAVLANKPKERRAMIIANSKIKAIVEARGLDYNNKEDMKTKKVSSGEDVGMRPALSPEARENQMISLAMDLVERRLREGTASSAETTHFLKLATFKSELEKEKLEEENKLLRAKTEALQAAKNTEEMYAEAIKAMRVYNGQDEEETDGY